MHPHLTLAHSVISTVTSHLVSGVCSVVLVSAVLSFVPRPSVCLGSFAVAAAVPAAVADAFSVRSADAAQVAWWRENKLRIISGRLVILHFNMKYGISGKQHFAPRKEETV